MTTRNTRFRALELPSSDVHRLCADLSGAFGKKVAAVPLTDVLTIPEAAKGAREIIQVPGLAIFLLNRTPFSTDFADTLSFRRNGAVFAKVPFTVGFAESVGSVHLTELEADVVGANAFHRIAGSIRVPPTLTLGEIFNFLE